MPRDFEKGGGKQRNEPRAGAGNLREFKNNTDHLRLDGPFSIELTDEADKNFSDPEIRVEGNVLHFTSIGNAVGNPGSQHPDTDVHITIPSRGSFLVLPQNAMVVIRDSAGEPIWVNHKNLK